MVYSKGPVGDDERISAQELLRAIELDIRQVLSESGEQIISLLDDHLVHSIESRTGERVEAAAEDAVFEFLAFGDLVQILLRNKNLLQFDPTAAAIIEKASDVARLVELRNALSHHRDGSVSRDAIEHLWTTAWGLFEFGFNGSRTLEQMRLISREIQYKRNRAQSDRILHNLPSQDYSETGFVGRQQLVRKLTEGLKRPPTASGTFTWLVGPGGVGKSALALEVAYRMMHSEKFELIYWASFKPGEFTDSGVQPILGGLKNLAELPGAIEGSIAGTSDSQSLDDIWKVLGDTPALLVLDNCESLEADQFVQLSESEPPLNIRFLLTSRTHGAIGMPHRVPDFSDDECRKLVGKLGKVFDSQVLLDIAKSDDAMASLLSRTGRTPLAIKWVAKRCARGDLLDSILATQGALFDYCVGAEFRELSPIARQVVELLHESKDWTSTSDLVSLIGAPYESLQHAMRELNDRMFLDQRSGDGITTQFRLNETVDNFLKFSPEVDVLKGVQNRRRIRALRQHASQNEVARQAKGYFSPYFVDTSENSQHAVVARLYECLGASRRQSPPEVELQLRMVKSLQESAPKYWEVFRVGAHLLHWLGKSADAADDMRRAVDLAPAGRPRARCLTFLAQILGEHDDQESLEVSRRAFEESPEWATQLELARRSYFGGRIRDAITTLEEMYKGSSEEVMRYIAAGELAKAYQRGSQMNVDTPADRAIARQFARDGLANLLQCYELRFLTREYRAERRGSGTNNSSRMVDVHLEMFSRYLNVLTLDEYIQEREFLDRVVEALSDMGAQGILDVVPAKQLSHSRRTVENLSRLIGPENMSDIFNQFIFGKRSAEPKDITP